MIRLLLAALLIVSPFSLVSGSEKAPSSFREFSEADRAKLRSGETVVWTQSLRPREPKKVSVLSAILLPVPLKDAWAVIDDKEGACEYISDLEKCKVIARNGTEELIEQTTRPPGAPRSFTYTLRHEETFPTRMDFQRESGDLRDIIGSWVFDPVDEGRQTLLIYALHIDAGMLVPQRMIRRSQEKQLPAVLVAIRDRLAFQKQNCTTAAAAAPVVATPIASPVATPIAAPATDAPALPAPTAPNAPAITALPVSAMPTP
jgi:hypothetical protein